MLIILLHNGLKAAFSGFFDRRKTPRRERIAQTPNSRDFIEKTQLRHGITVLLKQQTFEGLRSPFFDDAAPFLTVV